MNTPDSADIHALSGAYAVDAVDDIERAEFERHLATCADCREEVAGFRATAEQLSACSWTRPRPSGCASRCCATSRRSVRSPLR